MPGAPADAARIIDEYGQLDQTIQALTAVTKRHKQLEDAIRSWYADADPELPITVAGGTHVVMLTPRANARRILDMWKVYRAMGNVKAFLSICSVTLKALEKALGEERAAKLVVEDRTGPRRISVVPRLAAVSTGERAA